MESRNSLRRSFLGVPGNESQLIAEAKESDADGVFLDLEDSLAPGEKGSAREELIATVKESSWEQKVLGWRINGTGTKWWHNDIIEIVKTVGDCVDTLVIPKVSDAADVRTVATLLSAVEQNAGADDPIKLKAQIETAEGLTAVTEIAEASDRLQALVFGPADYAASVGASYDGTGYPGHYWHYPLARISQAAAGAGLLAIGGPHTDPYSSQEFEQACRSEAALGYDGKIVVHPDQIGTANRVFSPTEAEAERARRIVSTYENTGTDEVAAIDGKIIDREMYTMAKGILSKARKSGQL